MPLNGIGDDWKGLCQFTKAGTLEFPIEVFPGRISIILQHEDGCHRVEKICFSCIVAVLLGLNSNLSIAVDSDP